MTLVIKLDAAGTRARVLPFPPREPVARSAPVLEPGEAYLGIAYEGWETHVGETVDVPQLRRERGIFPSRPGLSPEQRWEAALHELPQTVPCPFCPGRMERGAAWLMDDPLRKFLVDHSYMNLVHAPPDRDATETVLSPGRAAVSWRCGRCDTTLLKGLSA